MDQWTRHTLPCVRVTCMESTFFEFFWPLDFSAAFDVFCYLKYDWLGKSIQQQPSKHWTTVVGLAVQSPLKKNLYRFVSNCGNPETDELTNIIVSHLSVSLIYLLIARSLTRFFDFLDPNPMWWLAGATAETLGLPDLSTRISRGGQGISRGIHSHGGQVWKWRIYPRSMATVVGKLVIICDYLINHFQTSLDEYV